MSAWYKIVIKGHLDRNWSDWFSTQTIDYDENDNTILIVQVPDQPALHGILDRIRNLNLSLISITPFDSNQNHSSTKEK